MPGVSEAPTVKAAVRSRIATVFAKVQKALRTFGTIVVYVCVAALLSVLGPYIVLLIIPPFMIFVSSLYLLLGVGQMRMEHPDVPLKKLPSLLLTVNVVIPFFYCALLAPVAALPALFSLYLFGEIPEPVGADGLGFVLVLMGSCGTTFALVWTARDAGWRSDQLRRLENVATSRARSAALGMSEFSGRARSLDSQPIARLIGDCRELRSFYVEDDSGRILVDPSSAEVVGGFQPMARFRRMWGSLYSTDWLRLATGTLCEVSLSRKRDGARELRDGDPIYVLGNVEVNEHAPAGAVDGERLVVRRNRRLVRPPWWAKLFWGEPSEHGARFVDVFFVTDSCEGDARKTIRRGAIGLLMLTLPWAGLSLCLIWVGLR